LNRGSKTKNRRKPMAKISYVEKMRQLDAAAASASDPKPGLLAALEDALGSRRSHSWIAGMLTNNFRLVSLGFKVTTKDVKGYLTEKWEPKKSKGGPSGVLPASTGEAEGVLAADPSAPTSVEDDLMGIDKKVVEGFKNQINVMVQEAMENPNGDASNMVRALALTSMVRDRAGFDEIDLLARYAAEVKMRELEIKLKRVQAAIREAERKYEEARDARQLKDAEAKQAVTKAEKDRQAGMPVDTRLLIEKVSAAIGLRGPLIPRVEKEARPAV
jgi:hypothetical protein